MESVERKSSRDEKDFRPPPSPLTTPLSIVYTTVQRVDGVYSRPYHSEIPRQTSPPVLSPLPPLFSSSASHSLTSRQSGGLHQTELSTECYRYRAEVVGGINGAHWVERGELWLKCQGCGWATKRLRDLKGQEENGKGKGVFESVKKRRKERERREKEANSHPTQFTPTPSLTPAANKTKYLEQKSISKPTASPSSSRPSIQSASNSKSNSPLPPPQTSFSHLPSLLPIHQRSTARL